MFRKKVAPRRDMTNIVAETSEAGRGDDDDDGDDPARCEKRKSCARACECVEV